jgi:hypothetical protein
MPRFSWSLAAALSMSALAVFRPEIGSKSLAAHAARSFTRVVESIAQRFQSSGIRVAANTRRDSGSALVRAEAVAVAAFEGGDRSVRTSAGSERHVVDAVAVASESAPVIAEARLAKYSSPPVSFLASLRGADSESTLAPEVAQADFIPQTRERLWKDCAIAAICSGIPSPATLHSTPLALGKPPSV